MYTSKFLMDLFLLWTHLRSYMPCVFFFSRPAGVVHDRYCAAVLIFLRPAENERGGPSDRRKAHGCLHERSAGGRGKPEQKRDGSVCFLSTINIFIFVLH